MERLNKKQKKILTYLYEVYPNFLEKNQLLEKLNDNADNVLADIIILEDNKFVKLTFDFSDTFPKVLMITPKGIEKQRETFTSRLKDSAHKNPWAVIAIIVTLILGLTTLSYYFENLELQNQIIQENELKQIKPPTITLTQKFRNGSFGELEIIPTFYFKKNSDVFFTIQHYKPNVSLNGKNIGLTGAGYETRFQNEGIIEGKIEFPSFHSTNYYNFFYDHNELVIDYVIEIKDMDSQIIYRGNVTTEIDSSKNIPTNFPSGRDPLIFNLTKI